MTAAMPYVFAALAALALGATVVAFYQAARALLGSVDEPDEVPDALGADERSLFDRRAALLEALAALDLDHAAGKLSDEDHTEEKSRLRAEAKAVLAAIETLVGPHRDAALALVEARRVAAESVETVPTRASAGADLASAASEATGSESAEAGGSAVPALGSVVRAAGRVTCASCGADNEPDASFCKRCGKALEVAS